MKTLLNTIVLSLFIVLAGGLNVASVLADTPQSAYYPPNASDGERQALDRLAAEIEGSLIYTRNGRVRKVTIGDWRVEDLGEGDFVRWGPLGKRIAILYRGAVYVMNADGSDRRKVVDGNVSGGDGCQIEFHTNGREIIYGTRDDGIWRVDIETGEKRDMNLPFDTEINISGDGTHMVMRRRDCYLVELPGTKYSKFAGGCSPCVSPDGTRITSNNGGHRTMDIREWNGKRLLEINAGQMGPDHRWDNMHWSNHDDFIAMQGDGKQHEAYAFRISRNQGTRLTWEGKTLYPDLFIAKDLKTGEIPMAMTVAGIESNSGKQVIAATSQRKTKQKTEAGESDGRKEAPSSNDVNGRAAKVRALTGGPTRFVWCQSVGGAGDYCALEKGTRLLGFCTEDGRGERMIRSEVTSYAKPIFTPDGQRVVYSDRSNNKIYILNWDGSEHKEIGSGYASDIWRDPATEIVWLYYRAGDGKTKGGIMRQQLDNPKVRESVWNKTPTGHESVPWFRLSADGTHAASAFPYSSCGVADLVRGEWEKYGNGCWASLAPDNSYSYFNFYGNHQEIGFYEAGKRNHRKINVAGGPGVGGKHSVYHPRWSNDVRFLTVTGPKQSDRQEILLGRFNNDFDKIEDWVQISHNDKPDFYGDAWIQSGWLAKLNQSPSRVLAGKTSESREPQDFSKHTSWPGDQRDLVFIWENNDEMNQLPEQDAQPGRLCQVTLRDRAVFGRFYELDLAGGAAVAKDADDALLDACKQSNQLTIEATITPGNVAQHRPASIVSFSTESGSSNFTLGQEQDTLVLQLRTPAAKGGGRSQLKLGKMKPGQPHHVVASYQSGRLTCHINGKLVLETNRVTGDFSNWEPAHLLFGDGWNGGCDWSGSLEGVAIYARTVLEPEATHKYNLYAARFSARKPADHLVVRARLHNITPTPSVKDLQEYSRALVVHSYEVLDVLKGKEQTKMIHVAHWALLDRRKEPGVDERKVGQIYELRLERWAEHPQLESERSFDDCEDFDAPLYYDIAGRSVPDAPMMVASTRVCETSGIRLKVNCAGPNLGDWRATTNISRATNGAMSIDSIARQMFRPFPALRQLDMFTKVTWILFSV